MSTLIYNCKAVLMDEAKTVLENAYITMEDKHISYVGTEKPTGKFDNEIDCDGNVIMPGIVNAHTHVPMVMMRGFGGGKNLQDWLGECIFPTEAKWDEEAIKAATNLGLAEMISSGVTTIADMYMFSDIIAVEAYHAGISANISCGGVLFSDDFDPDNNSDCQQQILLFEKYHNAGEGQILIDASIHGEYTSNKNLWEWMADFASINNIGMHMHLSETQFEHEECKKRHGGLTPVEVMQKYDVFDVRTIAAHSVWVTENDMEIMAKHNVSAIHNPISNLKLGSGIAPVPKLIEKGVNVCLGTDGVSSNNSTDLFSDIKFASILHNGANHDPLALSPYDALKFATTCGGTALGRKVGEIKEGYVADLVLIDFDAINNIPCHDVIENLVYSTNKSNVMMTIARGEIIYKNGEFFTIDIEKTKEQVKNYAMEKLFR